MHMNHSETCGICHTVACVHTVGAARSLISEPFGPVAESYSITPGTARGCPLAVTEDPDLFDYSNEGDATFIIEEVGNGR